MPRFLFHFKEEGQAHIDDVGHDYWTNTRPKKKPLRLLHHCSGTLQQRANAKTFVWKSLMRLDSWWSPSAHPYEWNESRKPLLAQPLASPSAKRRATK